VLLDFLRGKQKDEEERAALYGRLGEWHLARREYRTAYGYLSRSGETERVLELLENVDTVTSDSATFDGVLELFAALPRVTIDRPITITSDSDYTINTGNYSIIIVGDGEVSLEGSLSLTGTSKTIQVLYGGGLELPEYYSGTISTTGAGGKAIYAKGGTTNVHIAGGTILADSDAKSALSLGDHTTRVIIRGGTISGSDGAYGIYMEEGYGTPLNIYISESRPYIDDVYFYWSPKDAAAGDYLLLRGLPGPISSYVGKVRELKFDDYLGVWDATYGGNDQLNVDSEYDSDSETVYWTMSPDTTGVYNLILNIVGTELTIPVTVTTGFAGGDGTYVNPYQIATAEQLDRVRSFLGSAYQDTYFQLTAPIDLSSYTNWVPIGDMVNPFCGYIDGIAYDDETETYVYQTISNLTINRPDEDYVGLFGYCASAEIWDVAIRNANVTGGFATGALVGRSVGYIGYTYKEAQIGCCSSTGSVTSTSTSASMSRYTGGLVGMASETQINESYSTVSVTGTNSTAGGLVGLLKDSSISNCYATGSVSSTGEGYYAGGLVGEIFDSNGRISTCYAAGHVTGEDETGSLIGHSNSYYISESYFNIANAGSSDDGLKGRGLSSIDMMDQISYGSSWYFDKSYSSGGIWMMDWYPYLKDNEQIPHPAPPAATSARIVGDSGDPRYNAAMKTLTMTYGGNHAVFSVEDVTPADGLAILSSSNTAVTDIWWNSDGDIIVETMGAGTATVSLKHSDGSILDSITVIVEPIPLTVTGDFEVEDKEYDGGTDAFITGTSTLSLDTSDCIGNDAANLAANFVATFSDPDAGQNKTVSLSNSYLTGSAAGNYVLDFSNVPEVTGTITPKELTIGGSFTAQGKEYDGTTDAAIALDNLTLVGRVGNDDVTLSPFSPLTRPTSPRARRYP
jgi:hypothetical protein